MDWEKLQRQRLENIQEWHTCHFQVAQNMSPVIGYMILWAVFNALYNLAYLPERKVSKIREEYGYRIPVIYQKEREILRKFSKRLGREDGLINELLKGDLQSYLENLSQRRPEVPQPRDAVDVKIDGQEDPLSFADFRGLASIDRRVYREDGIVLYQYAPFDLELNENGQPCDRKKFIEQLVLFLYQLRNNIVHGGAAFVSTKKLIATQALPVLEAIVNHIFEHEEVILD